MWRTKLIEFLGGYVDAESAINATENYEERRKMLTYAVKRHFNTIGPEDILRENDLKQWLWAGKQLNEAQKKMIVAEMTAFMQSTSWEIIQSDLKYQANRKMYLLAENEAQITFGKMWQYVVDCINTRLKRIAKENAVPPVIE